MTKMLPNSGRRDNSAIAILNTHLPRLFNMAFRLTGNVPDSEDLLQDLVEKCCRRPDQFQNLDSPLTWLKRTLYNQFVDNYRRKRLQPVAFSEVDSSGSSDFSESLQSSDEGPEAATSRFQKQKVLQAALDALPSNQRELVLLHDVQGEKLVELEKILNEPLGTLKSRLHRARKTLRAELRDATF